MGVSLHIYSFLTSKIYIPKLTKCHHSIFQMRITLMTRFLVFIACRGGVRPPNDDIHEGQADPAPTSSYLRNLNIYLRYLRLKN